MTPKIGLGKSSAFCDEQVLFRMHEKEVRFFLVFLEKENYTQISKGIFFGNWLFTKQFVIADNLM